MKANSGFVAAMIALCGVTHARDITVDHIKVAHIQLMDQCLTSEAKVVFMDLVGDADQTYEDAIMQADNEVFIKSGLQNTDSIERSLVEKIYASQGRQICWGQTRIVVSPSQKRMANKRRNEIREKEQISEAHFLKELKTQPA